MPSSKLKKTALVLSLVTITTIVAGYAAVAASVRLRPATVVVTFNIGKVLTDLTEKAESEARLRSLITKIDKGLKERQGNIDTLKQSLIDAAEADREQIADMLEQETLEGVSYQRFAEIQIDNERSLMLRDLYNKIKSSIITISEENGYDIVLISDVEREVQFNAQSKVPREAQVLEQIGFQRAVYTSSQIDITEQIVTHMNLEWEKHADR